MAAMMAMLEGQEWVVIAVVALLLFGGSKLPELARSIGQAKSEFDKAVRGEQSLTSTEVESSPPAAGADSEGDRGAGNEAMMPDT